MFLIPVGYGSLTIVMFSISFGYTMEESSHLGKLVISVVPMCLRMVLIHILITRVYKDSPLTLTYPQHINILIPMDRISDTNFDVDY